MSTRIEKQDVDDLNIRQEEAEEQIANKKENFRYDTREYPVEVLIQKYIDGEFFIPQYQREHVWKKDTQKMSMFIESILLDIPLPLLFFADNSEKEGKLEVIDGSQRIRTLHLFYENGFALEGLSFLDKFNGLKFEDLKDSRKRRFLRKTMRSIELTESNTAIIRIELFSRINSKPFQLKPMQIRKGTYDGDFLRFLEECSKNKLFQKLCPLSQGSKDAEEDKELILRYFAYVNNYDEYKNNISKFATEYMESTHEHFENSKKEQLKEQFESMLKFVEENFPYGFKKTEKSQSTPKVRFEAIAVGVAFALNSKQEIRINDIPKWLNSKEFERVTTSDAANNKSRLQARINFVKNKLLGIESK